MLIDTIVTIVWVSMSLFQWYVKTIATTIQWPPPTTTTTRRRDVTMTKTLFCTRLSNLWTLGLNFHTNWPHGSRISDCSEAADFAVFCRTSRNAKIQEIQLVYFQQEDPCHDHPWKRSKNGNPSGNGMAMDKIRRVNRRIQNPMLDRYPMPIQMAI